MKNKPTLRRSILNAFMVSAALTGLVFMCVTLISINLIERELVYRDLDRDLERVLRDLAQEGSEPSLEAGMLFFTNVHEQIGDPPEHLVGLPEGLHLVETEGASFHALIRREGERSYALLQKRSSLLQRQRLLFLALAGGYLISVLVAWMLGHLLARRVIAPVQRLARQVGEQGRHRSASGPLAPFHADDEIGALAAAFDRAMAATREALERERLFTADVSHELRTPLMAMATSCELLRSQTGLTEGQYQTLARLQENCAQLGDTVQGCLFLARAPETGEGESVESVNAIVAAVTEQLATLAGHHGIQLCFTGDERDTVKANGSMLRIVVGNLIRNAIYHSRSTEIRVAVSGPAVSVIDHGKGMPKEAEHLFEPFSRGENAGHGGMGLGLSLVWRICHRQQWRIRISEAQPAGTEFRVIL